MFILLVIMLAFAHELQHSVHREGKCLTVSFFFPDNTKFSYEKYEVYKDGEKLPFQVGRTDALGRVVFCPGSSGVWKVKTMSEDGHGSEVSIDFEGGLVEERGKNLFERYEKVFIGVGILLGIFGFFELFIRRLRR